MTQIFPMTETNIITLEKCPQEAFVSFLETMVSFFAPEIKKTADTFPVLPPTIFPVNKKRHRADAFSALVSQEGFEPPTHRLEGGCSIRLSY